MKIIAFAGSNSRQSINRKFAEYVLSRFEADEKEMLDLNDFEMPLYGIDREIKDGIPALANDFTSKLRKADLVIISLAEHNGNVTTAFKNIFDWISRIKDRKVWDDIPVFLLSTAPGSRGGTSALAYGEQRLPRHGAKIIETFSLPEFNKHFSQGIIDKTLKDELDKKIEKVTQAIRV